MDLHADPNGAYWEWKPKLPANVRLDENGLVDDDAGIADQDIQMAKCLDRFGDQPFGVGALGDIGLNHDSLAAGFADPLGDRLGLVDGTHAVDDDLGALAGEALSHRLADTP